MKTIKYQIVAILFATTVFAERLPVDVTFGSPTSPVKVNESATKRVRLKNVGKQTATGIVVELAAPYTQEGQACSETLAESAECIITIKFSPIVGGSNQKTGIVRFFQDTQNTLATRTMNLSGVVSTCQNGTYNSQTGGCTTNTCTPGYAGANCNECAPGHEGSTCSTCSQGYEKNLTTQLCEASPADIEITVLQD